MLRVPRDRAGNMHIAVMIITCVYTDSYRIPCCLVHNTNTQFDKIIIKYSFREKYIFDVRSPLRNNTFIAGVLLKTVLKFSMISTAYLFPPPLSHELTTPC